MARKLRIQYPGAIYHVMNRGDRRQAIFVDDQDRRLFLATLTACCEKTGWQVLAYCLMTNHFHLVIQTPQANLVEGMKWLLGTYTGRFNRRHKEFGHLFSGRYKSLVVDGSGGGYLKTVCDYVHLGPVRAKLLNSRQPLKKFSWSSYPLYLAAPSQRPPWLRVARLMGGWGISKDSEAGRRAFARGMEKRRGEDLDEEFQPVERGWCLGDEEFRQKLLEQVSSKGGVSYYGELAQEVAEMQAERLVKENLKRMKWNEKDLVTRRKGDKSKVRLAHGVKAKSTVSLIWIAKRLKMGSRGYLASLLYRFGKARK